MQKRQLKTIRQEFQVKTYKEEGKNPISTAQRNYLNF